MAPCHLQCGKLLFSLVFRMLDVIYGAENCRAHLFFECSMSFAVRKIAARTCFSKARCHLRRGKLMRALFFKGLISFMVRKSAVHTWFFEGSMYLRFVKLPHAHVFRKVKVIYGPENCPAHLFFEGSSLFMVRKIVAVYKIFPVLPTTYIYIQRLNFFSGYQPKKNIFKPTDRPS